jgi:hypothetical protein
VAADGIALAKGLAARARNGTAAEASPVSAAQFEEFHQRLFLPLEGGDEMRPVRLGFAGRGLPFKRRLREF